MKKLLFWLIAKGNFLMPKRRQLLLHSFPDVEDQMVAVMRWLRDHSDKEWRIILLVAGDEVQVGKTLERLLGDFAVHIVIIRKTRLKAIWAYWRSSHVMITHGLFGFLPKPTRQCVINLWHGMPLKSIWKGIGEVDAPQCNWLLSTSPKYSEVLARASGFSVGRIPVTGLPRNDLLFSATRSVQTFAEETRVGVERVLLFLPTYRQSKTGYITYDGQETANVLALSESEAEALQSWLVATRTRMLVKPHPMSVHYGRSEKLNKHLWFIDDGWLHENGVTLYEALGSVDALITDASSVYIDYLSVRRPVFFFFPDIDIYRKTRKFMLEPIEEWLAGPLCRTGDDLLAALTCWVSSGDEYEAARKRLAQQLNPQIGSGSTQRVFDLITA